MKPSSKIGIVVGGYVAAFLAARAVEALYVASGSDRQASDGMAAFGEVVLFLVVFALAALVPTCAGLYFLRPVAIFWRVLSVTAVAVAATGVVAAGVVVALHGAAADSAAAAWSGAASLRLLAAPLLGGGYLVSGVFAPGRASRLALLSAVGLEGAAFLAMVVAMRMQMAGQ